VEPILYKKSETGSALAAVIIAMGLFSLIAVLYTAARGANLKANKIVESKAKYEKLERAFLNEMGAVLKSVDDYECLKKSSLANRPFAFEKSAGALKFVRDVQFKSDSAMGDSSADFIAGVKGRCTHPSFIDESQINNSAAAHSYFCLELDPKDGTPSAPGRSYAEVAIDFKASGTGEPISCRQFVNDPTAIAIVSYGLYLNTRLNDSDLYSKKIGGLVVKSFSGR